MRNALIPALEGTGPAVAPIPVSSPTIMDSLRQALRPDDMNFPLEADDISVVAATSGSTTMPRGVLLSTPALLASARAFGNRFGTDARWVLSMPAHRIAGIMVLTRSILHGSPVESDPSVGGAHPFAAATFAATTLRAKRQSTQDGRPLMVSLVPTQLARLVDAGAVGIEALLEYEVVLSGAAATPQPLLEKLRSYGINVVISYGMTETCGGCVFDGSPLDGVQVSIGAKSAHDAGRISLSGPVLTSGYRLRPDLDGVTLIEGRLMTEDAGRLDDAGLLHVLGRLDDVVIVGGVNVALSAVEAALRHHPNVADVAVVDYPDELWGALPVAYLVLRGKVEDLPGLLNELREIVASRIGRAATPRSFQILSSLPLLDSGKVDRLGIRIQAAKDIASGAMEHPGNR
jgi:O-succinylbenzoic acid--CoA ligase